MTDQEINEAIADATGKNNLWLVCKYGLYYRPEGKGYTDDEQNAWKIPKDEAKKREYPLGDQPVTIKKASVPDYCNDLNAMHEAEKVLRNDPKHMQTHAWNRYCEELGFFLRPQNVHDNNCVHAAAKQRAEAFLRTIGKWRDA